LSYNLLTTVPAEIGQLRSLKQLWLHGNVLTTLPAAIRELAATSCHVVMDDGVLFDEHKRWLYERQSL